MNHLDSKRTKTTYVMCVEAVPPGCRVTSIKQLFQSIIKYCSIAVDIQDAGVNVRHSSRANR